MHVVGVNGYFKGMTKPEEELSALWDMYGVQMVNKLNGSFCFWMTDNATNEIFAARDMLGTRQLFYTFTEDNVPLCGTSILNLLKLTGKDIKVCRNAVAEYLDKGYIYGKETIFEGVYKLDSGSYLHYSNGVTECVRYFNPSFERDNSISQTQWENEFYNITNTAIKAEKCKNCFLSSGIDSAYIAATLPADKTITAVFNNPEDESEKAKQTADYLSVPNIQIPFSANEFFSAVKESQISREQPTADPSFTFTYLLLKKAAKYCDAICSGESADEMLVGYRRYEVKGLTTEDIVKLQCTDIKELLGDDFFPSLEAGMRAFGIEVHYPYADRAIVELCMRMPIGCNLSDVSNKTVLRNAASRVLPQDIISRKKIGFYSPLKHWMEQPEWSDLINSTLNDGTFDMLVGKKGTAQYYISSKFWRERWKAFALVVWYHGIIL